MGEGGYGGGAALGVALEDETFRGVGGEGGVDFVDDLEYHLEGLTVVICLLLTSLVPVEDCWSRVAG